MGWPRTIDSFFAEYLGCDLAALGPGEVVVAGSSRRYAPEPHYEHVFALWLVASGSPGNPSPPSYAKTAVSHTTKAILDTDRIPVYITSDRNKASIATAKSVGHEQHGWDSASSSPAD